MARSRVDLANAALAYLVRGSLPNLDGGGMETVQIKGSIDEAIEAVIEQYDWPECRVIGALLQVTGIDLRGWAYAYAVPSDMVKPWSVGDQRTSLKDAVPYERGMSSDISSDTQYIFTDQASAYLRYGSSRVSVGRFSASVFDLMALKLATLICLPIAKDAKLLQVHLNLYEKKLSSVKTLVANAEPEVIDTEFVPESISVRSQ